MNILLFFQQFIYQQPTRHCSKCWKHKKIYVLAFKDFTVCWGWGRDVKYISAPVCPVTHYLINSEFCVPSIIFNLRERGPRKLFSLLCMGYLPLSYKLTPCNHSGNRLSPIYKWYEEGIHSDNKTGYLTQIEWYSWRSTWGLFGLRLIVLYKVQDRDREINLVWEGKRSDSNGGGVKKHRCNHYFKCRCADKQKRPWLCKFEMVVVDLV